MFRLDCGRQVAVDAFYYQRTYAGHLAGSPDRERTLEMIEEGIRSLPWKVLAQDFEGW